MNPKTHPFLTVITTFLLREIQERRIEILVPLESKGALLLDLALECVPAGVVLPKILYVRSLDYLDANVRQTARFGVVDDFLISGRTLQRAVQEMGALGISREQIHPMAFFSFAETEAEDADLNQLIATTAVPRDQSLSRLSRNGILREVQQLATEHKIPASYDNLSWNVVMDTARYRHFMGELAKTGSYLYYGRRGNIEASALLVRAVTRNGDAALPKLRFWYNESKQRLYVCPISFSASAGEQTERLDAELKELLTPDRPLARRDAFASYLAHAFSGQIVLLGYLKSYFKEHALKPQLNQRHLERYFGPRAPQVIRFLVETYPRLPELTILVKPCKPRRLEFYSIAVEIMRELGRLYWAQPNAIKVSQGLSVKELVAQFQKLGSLEAVHAAVDYLADKNLIATFFRWEADTPTRAFRLTENGESEVGRNVGKNPTPPTFIEKVGALILWKSKNHQTYWWSLEKIVAILIRRLPYSFSEFEAAVDHFGDTVLLHPTEASNVAVTWLTLDTKMWDVIEKPIRGGTARAKVFKLSIENYKKFESEIVGDARIIYMMGAVETLIEMIRSPTLGHRVAILLDILSDQVGGATYLAKGITRALDRIDEQRHLTQGYERRYAARDAGLWLKGADEKCELLGVASIKLIEHITASVERLKRQGRGEIAVQLMRLQPLPNGNRIIPAFRDLISIVGRLNDAVWKGKNAEIQTITRGVSGTSLADGKTDNGDFATARKHLAHWVAALSAEQQEKDTYLKFRLDVARDTERRLYIVAYDLIGSSSLQYDGKQGAGREYRIQSIITNWIIAFGGQTQHVDFARGDLGFGFFTSAQAAIQACLWAVYHLNLIKDTDPTLRQPTPHAGFAVITDMVNGGFMGQAKTPWLSRFAKAWKHEAERIADNSGRDGHPPVAVHNELFGLTEIPPKWLGATGELDGIPVRFVREDAMQRLPWQS